MEWCPAGWSVCLPLLIFPCTIKSRNSPLAPAHPGGPGKRAIKRLLWCGENVATLRCELYGTFLTHIGLVFIVPPCVTYRWACCFCAGCQRPFLRTPAHRSSWSSDVFVLWESSSWFLTCDVLSTSCVEDSRKFFSYVLHSSYLIIIIINQFVTHQMPVSQILRRGGRYATSQFGLIVKSNIKQMCL